MFKTDLNKFDIRLVHRLIETGEVTPEEYQKILAGLEDCSENVVVVDPTFGEGPGEEAPSANA